MVLKITSRELLVIICVISVPLSFTNPVDLTDLAFEKDQIEFDKLFKESEKNVFPIGNMPGQVLAAGCECKNGKCEQQGEKEVCVCPPEFGHLTGSYCKACNCGTGINCTFEGVFNTETICLCPDGSTVRNEKCKDPCEENNPCKNYGLCKVESSTVKCECKSSYSGEFCEKDPCSPNPCKNNGICELRANDFQCICMPEYDGDTCLLKNLCTPNPCKNNGTCELRANGFQCICMPEYDGDTCLLKNPTSTTMKPTTRITSTTTDSPNPCTPNPCKNNGTCELRANGFQCICMAEYNGDTCLVKNPTTTTTKPTTRITSTTIDSLTDTCEELQCDTSTTDCDKLAQQCKCKDGLKQADGIKNKCFTKTCDELNCDLSTSVCDLEKANCRCKFGYEEDPLNKSRCINPCQRNATYCGLESGAVCYYVEDAREVLCLCKKGSLVYNEEKKKCEKICTKDNDCLNNGYCKKIGEFGFCHCPETFMGDYCEVNRLCKALESTCSKKGAICHIVHNRAVCQCPANQMYNALSESCEDVCYSNSCDQGKCIPKQNQYMCKCFDGYTGRLCNEKQKQEKDGDQHLWNISISTILIFMLFLLLTNTYYHCRRK